MKTNRKTIKTLPFRCTRTCSHFDIGHSPGVAHVALVSAGPVHVATPAHWKEALQLTWCTSSPRPKRAPSTSRPPPCPAPAPPWSCPAASLNTEAAEGGHGTYDDRSLCRSGPARCSPPHSATRSRPSRRAAAPSSTSADFRQPPAWRNPRKNLVKHKFCEFPNQNYPARQRKT